MIFPKLTAVQPLDDFRLLLSFGDEKRLYDFKPNLAHKYYSPLADVHLFQRVHVVDGEIEWVTGQDFCPHTLYADSQVM